MKPILIAPNKPKAQNVTPSTRDLMQFISPNPTAKNRAYYLHDATSFELTDYNSQFATWEQTQPACFIIRWDEGLNVTDATYLTEALKTLSCPLIKMQNVSHSDAIFDARVLGFDAQITEVKNLSAKEFLNLFTLAQSMHFRIIPSIIDTQDLQKVIAANVGFMYVTEELAKNLPPLLQSTRTILMAPDSATPYTAAKIRILLKDVKKL